jgi:NADH:ubiquinone oxidoreductase subunit 3 (subunit A)
MQAFAVHWLQWLFVAVLIGLGLSAFIFLGFYLPNRPGPPPRPTERTPYPAGIEVVNRGIPPVLLLLYLILFTFIIAYIAYMAIFPINF